MRSHSVRSLCVFLGLLFLVSRPAFSQVFPYPVHRSTLDNGLKVLLIPMPSEGLVSYWTVVRTGSRDEVEKGVTGFAHFFEHMMFRGSEKFPGPIYDGIVTSMGADANAYTTDDLTAYHMSITRDDLATVVEIESDRFQNLQYTEDQFRTEAGAVYGEFRKGRTNPFSVLFEAVQNAAFDRHTYKHTTIGFEADIEQMPEQYQYSKSFFERFYRPDNVVVMVTGDIEVEPTLKLIREGYGGWKPGYKAPPIPQEPEQTAQRRIEIPFDGRTLPILAVSFKGDRLLPKDRVMMAATLIADIAFGETSPLYKKLVLNEQRLQILGANFGMNRDPKLWSVIAMVKDPADVRAIEQEIFDTVADLRKNTVDRARLDAVRSNFRNGLLSGLSTPGAVAGGMARFVALTGDVVVIDEMFTTLESVTPEDVRTAAVRYLKTERSTVAVVHTKGQGIPKPTPAEPPVLLAIKDDPNVAFRLWFKVGSQQDPPGKEGLAALTAALLSEGGTENRSYEEILEGLFPLAAGYNGSVDKEMTVFTGVVYRDSIEEYYDFFADALLRPGFHQSDFERLKSQMILQLEKSLRYSSDEELGKAALYGRVFRKTPYQHLSAGTVGGLNSITIDDIKSFYRKYYTWENVTIGLGGAFDETLLHRLIADLGALPSGRPEAARAVQPGPISGRQVVLVEKPGQSTAISMGYPIDVHRGSREFYALWIANSWLGEHRNSVSHLYQVIREERGMNYGDYSYIEAFTQGGRRSMPPTGIGRHHQLFEIWIRPVPDQQAVFALRAALRETEKFARNGLTAEQFETQRNFLRKYVYQFATDTESRLGYAVDDRFYGIDGHLVRFREMMGSITHEEVNAAIRKHIQVNDIVIAMVTADAEGLKKALVSNRPTSMDYGGINTPDEVLEEDKEIERYSLEIRAEDVTIVPVEKMFLR